MKKRGSARLHGPCTVEEAGGVLERTSEETNVETEKSPAQEAITEPDVGTEVPTGV